MALIIGASAVTVLVGAMTVPLARSVAPTVSVSVALVLGAAAIPAIAVPLIVRRLRRHSRSARGSPQLSAVHGLIALACVGGVMLVSIAAWRACQIVRNPHAVGHPTAVRESLVDTGRLLAQGIERITTPAMQRGRKIAADPWTIAALTTGNIQELTSVCDAAIANSTEIDAVALFDAQGRIVAVNTRYTDGREIPRDRVDRIMGTSFSDREIINSCVNNAARSDSLEFQTTCDITPAFFDSSGLSVAHSMPVYGPSGAQLGVVSTRLRFERITELAEVRSFAGGQGTVRFVTDKGGFFDEAYNRDAEPPIPPEELVSLTAPLADGGADMSTVSRRGTFHALFRMIGLRTTDGGGIQVLLSVPEDWVRREANAAAALEIGTPAAAGLLLLLVAATLRSGHLVKQRARVAAMALRESQALRSTLDAHALVSVADTKGRIIEVNERFCLVSGYSREELLGHDHRVLNSGTHPKAFWVDVWRTLAAGRPWRGEVCNKAKDGSLYWVDTIIAPFTDADGTTTKYVSIRTDITERRRTEDALKRGEERWRGVMDSGMLGLFMWDTDGRIYEGNQAFLETVGYSTEDLREGRIRWRDMTPPELAPRDEEALREIAASGRCLPYEKEYLRKDGSRVPILLGAARLSDGKADQGIAFAMDITDRKRADAKAREAQEFLRNVIDSLSAHTVVINSEGTILSFNRAWEEFAVRNGGAGAAVLEGANYLAACDRAAPRCEEAAQVAAAIRAVLAGESSPPMIEYACHAPQEKRWFFCSIRGFSLKEQRFAVVSHLNTTALKLAERELTRSNEALAKAHAEVEERVKQRTAQLADATVAAQAASKAKSEFLATMSHEIRTPLNGLVGTLELLQGSSLSEQQKRYIQIGKTSALSLTSVINDILDFSKVEAGKLELSPLEFNLHSAVGDVMEMMAVRASEKGLELACSIDPALPVMVCGDAERLRQIIINMVNNAIKFTEHGAITLRVAGVGSGADQRMRIRFSVRDTGIGIPKDRLDRLFKAFSQTDASFSRKYGGTGLGLAICKQLAELMGGCVGVESEPGVGSTFWFEVELPAVADQSVALPARLTVDCRSLRLLVVEDHDAQREFIAECLASLQFTVETAADGDAALAMLLEAEAAGRPFATVLTDQEMPGMDGIEVAAAMQSKAELASIPVILLSSALEIDPERVLAAGFASHLTKPIRQSSLLDAVMAAVAPRTGTITRTNNMDTGAPADRSQALEQTSRKPRLRVLLAEDNEINQLIACELLARNGFDCTVASNGIAAVAVVSKDQFDLVLMDCQMPEMDGFEATREIRKQEQAGALAVQKGRRLPIIALTANALKGDRERCIEAGMDAYSTKPIDLKQLTATIESLISAQTPARSAA